MASALLWLGSRPVPREGARLSTARSWGDNRSEGLLLDVLILVGVLVVLVWSGVSLLRDTELGDELLGCIQDAALNWVAWAVALIVVALFAAVMYVALT